MNKKQYKIHDDKVYEVVENNLYTTYSPCAVPTVKSVAPQWRGNPIPFQMWRDITDWCVLSYEKFKSETLVFLYYDLDNNKNPWSFWIVPQITNGMTVKSNPESEFFAEERKNFPDTMFGTVHHHCSSSAFQSGTDHADELDREGLHFTIGNLDQPFDLDVHLRITLGTSHGEVEAATVISADTKIQKCFESLQPTYNTTTLKQAFDSLHESSICSASKEYKKREKEFSKSYNKVEKPKYQQSTTYQKRMLGGGSYGYGQMQFNHKTGWYSEKKTENLEEVTYASIAEDVLTNCILTLEVDNLRQSYEELTNKEGDVLTMYNMDDAEVGESVLTMLQDTSYLKSSEGLQLLETIESYLEETWALYDVDMDSLTDGLDTYLYFEEDSAIEVETFI